MSGLRLISDVNLPQSKNLINNQNIYDYLDSKPHTMSAKDHRTAYGTDGDYFSKPSVDDVFERIYSIMNELNPGKFPL